jgi:hypothetical protein
LPHPSLEHLQNTYARSLQFNTNEQELAREWDPSQVPIEHLWIRVKEYRRLAAAGHDLISEATAMRKTLNSIEQTGQFEDAALDWRKNPDAAHSWVNFKTHFKAADVERKRKVTAQSGGFHGANLAASSNLEAPLRATIQAKFTNDLEARLRATIQAKHTAATAPVATRTPSEAPPPRERTKSCPIKANWSYCWTHGLYHNATHNSANCSRKRDDHEPTATVENMMGGNPMISHNVGKKLNDQFMCTYNNRTSRRPLK